MVSDGESIKLSSFIEFHIETEIGFKICKDINKPMSTVHEAEEFLESVHTCFDILDIFFNAIINVADGIAAGGCASNLVVGKVVEPKGLDYSKSI